MHHMKHRSNCANERRVVHVDSLSLSLPLDERRADVIVIVGKCVHTANDPLLLDSRFAKKEKKIKK